MVFGDKKWSKFHYFTQKIMADIIGRVTDTIGRYYRPFLPIISADISVSVVH